MVGASFGKRFRIPPSFDPRKLSQVAEAHLWIFGVVLASLLAFGALLDVD
jgi:hypothetical protein